MNTRPLLVAALLVVLSLLVFLGPSGTPTVKAWNSQPPYWSHTTLNGIPVIGPTGDPKAKPELSSPATNLIVNGDFEQGNTGFTSQYTYSPGNIWNEGTYDVVSNPHLDHSLAASFGDHTSGSGLMLAANGSLLGNLGVWKETLNVTPNTNYDFSAWIASWYPASPARLQFIVNFNNSPIAIFDASSTTGLWQQFTITWNSGSNTSATIQIVDLNPASYGNDFALDDLALIPRKLPVIDYFALGDSIASGRGLMDDTANGGDPNGCRRSKIAYPAKVAQKLESRYSTVNFHLLACDGAATSLPDDPDGLALVAKFPYKWFDNQVSDALTQISSLPPDRPVLVSITIGVNDLGWDPRNIGRFLRLLYINDGTQFSDFVDREVAKVKDRVKTEVSRLLAKPNVVVVITDYHNPVNRYSVFFLGNGVFGNGNDCGVRVNCYVRTEDLIHKLNGVPLDIQSESTSPAQIQPVAVHGLFHAENGHESPRGPDGLWGGCGLAAPDFADTWVQYPADRDSNSNPLFPDWITRRTGIPTGDCFHPNEKGANAYASVVYNGALRAGR